MREWHAFCSRVTGKRKSTQTGVQMGSVMNKQEFTDKLQEALNGNVSAGVVRENVAYYEDYISTEVRKGKTEREVLQALGDPRLIARTIMETNGTGYRSGAYQDAGYQNAGSGNTEYQGSGYRQGSYGDSGNTNVAKRSFRMPVWAWIVLVVVIIALIISAVCSVLSFLAPVLIPVLVIVFLVKLFRDWLN